MKSSFKILMILLLTAGSMFFLSSCNIDNTTPPGTDTTDTDSTAAGTGADDTDTGGTDTLPGGIVYTGSLPEDLDSVTDTQVYYGYSGPAGGGLGGLILISGLLSDNSVTTGSINYPMVYEHDEESYNVMFKGLQTVEMSTEANTNSVLQAEGINPLNGEMDYNVTSWAWNNLYITFASSSPETTRVRLSYNITINGDLEVNQNVNESASYSAAYVNASVGFGMSAKRMEYRIQFDEITWEQIMVFVPGSVYYDLSGRVKLGNTTSGDGTFEIVGTDALLYLNHDNGNIQNLSDNSKAYHFNESFDCSFNININDMVQLYNRVDSGANIEFSDTAKEGEAKAESDGTRSSFIDGITAVDPDDSDSEITIYMHRAE